MAMLCSSTLALFCSCSACEDMSTKNSTYLKRAHKRSRQHPELQSHRSATHRPPGLADINTLARQSIIDNL